MNDQEQFEEDRRMVKMRELEYLLDVSQPTVDRWMREGMPHIRIGFGKVKHKRFEVEKVMAWLEKRYGGRS